MLLFRIVCDVLLFVVVGLFGVCSYLREVCCLSCVVVFGCGLCLCLFVVDCCVLFFCSVIVVVG